MRESTPPRTAFSSHQTRATGFARDALENGQARGTRSKRASPSAPARGVSHRRSARRLSSRATTEIARSKVPSCCATPRTHFEEIVRSIVAPGIHTAALAWTTDLRLRIHHFFTVHDSCVSSVNFQNFDQTQRRFVNCRIFALSNEFFNIATWHFICVNERNEEQLKSATPAATLRRGEGRE